MKKICLFIAVLFLSCFFLSCDSEGSNTRSTVDDNVRDSKGGNTPVDPKKGLDEKIEAQILQAYLEKLQSGGENVDLTINDVWVDKYYGTYYPPYIWWKNDDSNLNWDTFWDKFADENNIVFAVMLGVKGQDYGTEQWEISIRFQGGRTFVRDGNSIFLWHDRQLYDLADFYIDGLMVSSDFLEIANQQNGLDIETHRRIQEDYGKSMPRPWNPKIYNEMPIQYLGTYNGYIVVFQCAGGNATPYYLEIAGVLFSYSSSGSGTGIFAWKEGEIYKLQDMYEQNLITRNDLVRMAYNLNGFDREEE